jgi:hypothetical protein
MSEEAPVPAKPNRLTEAQRTEALALYTSGTATADQIADKLKVPVGTIRSLFKRKGVKKGEKAKELEAKKEALVHAALAIDPAVHAQRVFDTKNESYRYFEMISKLAIKQIVECQSKSLPLGSIQNDIKTLSEAAKTIKICREERFAVLGIKIEGGDDEHLPPLHITGLSEDQIRDLQEREASAAGELEIPDFTPEVPDE